MSVEYDIDQNDDMSEDDITMLESVTGEQDGEGEQLEAVPRTRKLTSIVWQYFDLVKDKKGNQKAICRKCKKAYKYKSSKGGTSTLKRHRKACMAKQLTGDVQQLLLSQQNGEMCTRERTIDQFKFREFVAALIIGITSDMWTSVNTTGYISLTAHFVDKDYVLQKFLLNFSPLPPPHTGQRLSDKLFEMLTDWGIEGRIGTISLDNAANNGLCVKIMKKRFIAKKVMSDVGKKNFHIRCCAHIIALIVKEGLLEIDRSVIKIRESVKYIKGSQIRKQNFLNVVRDLGMSVRMGVRQDVKTRWNSTYLMLESCIAYEGAFIHLKLIDPDYAESPNEEEWMQIKVVTKFLKVFYDLTTLFSGNKYPTSNLYFDGICQIRVLLEKELTNEIEFIRSMAKNMKAKFDKYWLKLNPILAMAVVLDPRLKFKFVEFTFKKLYPSPRELKKEVDVIYKRMSALFKEYHTARGSTTNVVSPSSGLQNVGSTAHKGTTESEFMQEFSEQEQNGRQQSDKSELDQYLSEQKLHLSTQIDILQYWKGQQLRFPTLTRMAADILAIPISTVASESAFSLGGRVLDRYRSSLSPESAEALITTRDWLYGIGVGSSDFVVVEDKEICEDVLGFESTSNNEAVSSYASN